ncbi:VWA domain-containing protein [Deinococcus sp. 6GRE01]|uniref:VWA domain-containing protein n=1 Tax=Deinococcus sp. 6GRE01 TaxID=2745873 RepID=UPI001E5ED267|nr:VWA domain-containing protein [Deinococcus sp. 6GRE01]MCD0155806.1 VWA domain-containing protein [Deinococcus sp. 6GRE01]
MAPLLKGQRLALGPQGQGLTLTVHTELDHPDVDLSLFALNDARTIQDDSYLTFFNQPTSPGGEVRMTATGSGTQFTIDLDRLPAWISRLVLCATSDSQPIGRLQRGQVTVTPSAGETLQLTLTPGGQELAVMLVEIYRHQGAWRVTAVEQGFNGGMAALVRSFGGDVAEESPADASAPTPAPVSPAPEPITKVELRKQQVSVVLTKAGVSGLKARVMVVMDASGSMGSLYSRGTVQETLERLIPVAARLDDNNAMEFWYYADRFARMGDLDEDSVLGVAGTQMPQVTGVVPAVKKIGYGNNEPPVMQDVLSVHREAAAEDRAAGLPTMPTLVLFITDGGISGGTSRQIEKIIKDTPREALFWQFVGLGRADYGVLAKLDTLQGRVIDNSGFFAVDDIDHVTDEQLYTRMLSEFAQWWKKWSTLGLDSPPAAPAGSRLPAAAPAGTVSLKKNASVSIRKAQNITITLSWTGNGDLDLYAFYALKNGVTGKVYYKDRGSAAKPPYITLSGDSQKAGKETAVIHRPDELAHVVFAAYSAVSNGAGSFASYRPTTIFTDDLGQEVRAPVLGRNHFSFWVALSAIDLTGTQARISHLERYSSFGTERSPLLQATGKLEMNRGVIEFKDR